MNSSITIMDTIENTPAPVGGEDVTSSQDTAVQVDTQPVESVEPSVDGATTEEAGVQAKLAGKYENPQELEKAYKELESKLGAIGQKASVVSRLEEMTGMQAQEIADFLERQAEQREAQELAQNPAGYALKEVRSLKQQIDFLTEEKALDGFLQQNPEYAPFKDKIFKLGLGIEREKSYEDIANEYFGQAIAQGQQSAYKKIDAKKNTQATSVSSAPKRQISQEDFSKLSIEEMEALLPHADTSQRLY